MATCAYCAKPLLVRGCVYQDHSFCNAAHAELWAQRTEIENDPRHIMNGRRILHDVGLDNFRRETRRVGCTPRKR